MLKIKGGHNRALVEDDFRIIPDYACVGDVWMHEKVAFKFSRGYLVSSNFKYFLREVL